MKTVYRLLLVLCLAPLFHSAQSENWHFSSIDTISLGIEMHNRSSYDSAIAMFSKIHPGDTNYDLALYEKAFSLYNAERYEEALKIGRQGYDRNGELNIEFATVIGNSLDELGMAEEAKATYDSAIDKFPGSAKLYYNRGVAHLGKERWELGFNDLKKAIELNPYHASSHYQLARYALYNGNFTQSLLSLGYYFISEPASGRTNSILQVFNTALSEKTELEAIDYDFDPKGTYAKSDRLIKSYAALRDAYDIDSDANFPLIKQMHLAITQSAKLRNKTDFWAMYYLPYYKKVIEEDQFEVFSYLLSLSIQNEYYSKLIEKNIDDIKELVNWNSSFVRDHHGLHPLDYKKGAEMVKFYFHDGTSGISARGKVDDQERPIGTYQFYYAGGGLSGKGELNKEGLRTGTFYNYHPNGSLKEEGIYSDGELDGPSKEYHENGAPAIFADFKAGKLHGEATIYDENGAKSRVFTFKDNIPVDTLYLYHSNGQLKAKIPFKDGTENGKATYYHEDASLLSHITLKAGERSGPAEFYFSNGQLDVKAVYNEAGKFNGPYESYHSNGQLYEAGTYVDGIRVGNWKNYNPDGKQIAERSFDERGKKTGTEIYYDDKGRKSELFQYKKEEMVYFEDYDLTGAIQAKGKAKRGILNYQDLDLYGSLLKEGPLDETHRIGEWKEYSQYGKILRKITYTEEGEYEGKYIDYHASNGEISSQFIYQKDTLHGPYFYQYSSGQVSSEGSYYKGNRQGLRLSYFPNGVIETESFYVNGRYNGPRKYYDPVGQLKRIEYFKEGTITKMETYWKDSLVDVAIMKDPLQMLSLKYPNGQVAFEINRTGRNFQGKANWYFGNGQLEIEAQYIDGNRDGMYKTYYPNGQLRSEGAYDLGKQIGEWKYYHENGALNEIVRFVEGEQHGPNPEYNKAGIRVDSLNYVFDELDGNRYFYTQEGELQHVRVYDLGKIIGWRKLKADGSLGELIPLENGTGSVKAHFPNGKVAMEYSLDKGFFTEAPYKTYYSNGQLESEIQHKNGENNGWSRKYYANGQLESEVEYLNDYKNGEEKRYHANGQLAKKISWVHGKLQGRVSSYDENGKEISSFLYIADDLYE